MKIDLTEKNNKVIYEIKASGEYDKVLKDNLYEKQGEKHIKCFELPFDNKEHIKANFLKYGSEMFTDIKDEKPMKWQEGLKHFANIAKKAGIEWWTNGKAALALMGVDIEVDDLDFIFDYNDIDKVNETYKDYIIEPICTTKDSFRSNIVKYYGVAYSHCRTCFMFEPYASLDNPEPVHFGRYAQNHLETVIWNGLKIKVAPLDLHLSTYKRWNIINNVEKIEEFMKSKPNNYSS